MAQKDIRVEKRDDFGSGAMRRMRKAGRVPAVLYADGNAALPLSVDAHEFMMVGRGSRKTQLFRLQSEDKELNEQIAFVKEVQLEPLKETLLHVDFLAVAAGKSVHISVPIDMVGEPAVVKQGEAIIQRGADSIDVECIPSKIPESIVIQVGELTTGDAIHAGDLQLPEGVELLSPADQTVVGIVAARLSVASTATEEAEAVEGEEAEGAEGAKEGE